MEADLTQGSSPFGLREKLVLVTFGLLIGALGIGGILWFRQASRAGSAFESIDELRRVMLESDAKPTDQGVSLRSIITPHPDDNIIFDLRPHLNIKFQSVPVTTNECGMRDKPRRIPRSEDTLRIALMGDSFAFGWGVLQDDSFASVLEARLNAIPGRPRPTEVLNFGIPGYSTFQEVALFKEKALDFDPDIILFYFVDNDFGFPFFIHDKKAPGTFLSATDFARRIWNGPDQATQEQHAALGKKDPGTSLRSLAKIAQERGIKMVVAINPRKEWLSDRDRILGGRPNPKIQFVDMRTPLLETIEARGLNPADLQLPTDPHPNAKKHRILGDILASYLMEYQ